MMKYFPRTSGITMNNEGIGCDVDEDEEEAIKEALEDKVFSLYEWYYIE